jgi:hypothetical protein
VRIALNLLGCEVIAFEIQTGQDSEPAEIHGAPFGFSGGAMCQAEYGDQLGDETVIVNAKTRTVGLSNTQLPRADGRR